eukprot:m.23275 g.23275  ORF g.23275 m.23275 type:complete len:88 (-) comp5536_c0_seq2:944-1207(-)
MNQLQLMAFLLHFSKLFETTFTSSIVLIQCMIVVEVVLLLFFACLQHKSLRFCVQIQRLHLITIPFILYINMHVFFFLEIFLYHYVA